MKNIDFEKFLKYVETYDPERDGCGNLKTIIHDLLYGIGISINEEYKFIDGYVKFKQYIKNEILKDV